MTYASGNPVRLVGGRLALDLANTADWSAGGDVVHEKIETNEDLAVWLHALGMEKASQPATIAEFHAFRKDLRTFFRSDGTKKLATLRATLHKVDFQGGIERLPILGLASISALSIMMDARERERIKTCPGENCGWMFIDETKNGRRTWCLMETCGNRAKAARHYQKTLKKGRES